MFPTAAVLWLVNVLRGSETFTMQAFLDHAIEVLNFLKTLTGGPVIFGASADESVAAMTEAQVADALEAEATSRSSGGVAAAGMNPILAALLLKAIEFALKKWLGG